MKSPKLAFFILRMWLICTPIVVLAATQAAPNLVEITDGVYVRQGNNKIVFAADNIANVGAIVGERCVAVVDTGGSPKEGRALRDAIERISKLPICYVINTHAHPDHFLGNAAFKDIVGVQFLGHSKMADSAESAKNTWLGRLSEQRGSAATDADWVMPTRTISSRVTLDLGNRKIQLDPIATAHSYSDVTVLDHKTSTLWLSDLLFVQHTPVLAGSLTGWISSLKDLLKHRAEHIIPGHGPIRLDNPTMAIQRELRYLSKLQHEVSRSIKQGDSLFDVQTSAKQQSHKQWVLYKQYHARNIARAWAELEWLD